MLSSTLRIIDGPDRGKVFSNLAAPITIGREDGNTIELNDERVSRFHLKIFEREDKAALADLGSTNGTLVNGEPVNLWVLRPGDLILIGKTLLLFGSQEEIAQRLHQIETMPQNAKSAQKSLGQAGIMGRFSDEVDAVSELAQGKRTDLGDNTSLLLLAQKFFYGLSPADLERLRTFLPPELPDGCSADMTFWLSDFFLYLILRLRSVIMGLGGESQADESVRQFLDSPSAQTASPLKNSEKPELVQLQQRSWQNLLDLYSLIAEYQYTIQPR